MNIGEMIRDGRWVFLKNLKNNGFIARAENKARRRVKKVREQRRSDLNKAYISLRKFHEAEKQFNNLPKPVDILFCPTQDLIDKHFQAKNALDVYMASLGSAADMEDNGPPQMKFKK